MTYSSLYFDETQENEFGLSGCSLFFGLDFRGSDTGQFSPVFSGLMKRRLADISMKIHIRK